MTLDEAIKRYTDNAEFERTHGNLQGCLEFKKLAEWLRELKALRDNEEVKEVFKNCDTCAHESIPPDSYPCDRCCHRYLNQYEYDKTREVNTDE